MLLIDRLFQLGPILFVFMEILEPLLLKFVKWDKYWDKIDMPQEPIRDVFDFIIGKIPS